MTDWMTGVGGTTGEQCTQVNGAELQIEEMVHGGIGVLVGAEEWTRKMKGVSVLK